MYLGQEYNVGDLPETQGDFTPIPAGWYQATISSAELKDAKSGGKYINIRFDITGADYSGRVIFDIINIINKSQKAEEIGRAQLGSLMRAMGKAKVRDTDELIGGNVMIKVAVQKSIEYGDKNVVKSYKAIDGGVMPSQQQSTQQNTVPRPPWAK